MGGPGSGAVTGQADLILVGGTVVDLLRLEPAPAQQIAVRAGVILEVGVDLSHHRGPATDILNVAGAAVLPGLVDGHLHPVMGLDLLDAADLSRCHTPEQVRAALTGQAERRPDGWLIGWGLDPGVFGSGPVTNSFLDLVSGRRPALVHVFDGHAAVAGSAALELAGITGRRRLPGGAEVAVDEWGRPTGHLLEEAAVALITSLIPAATQGARRQQLAELLRRMASTGLTGGHVMDAKDDALTLLGELDEAGELPLRLRVAPWHRPDDDPAKILDLQGRGGEMWSVDGVKMFLDGSIDGGTAWLTHPDGRGDSVTPGWDPEEYRRRLDLFDAVGVPTATHAIGDAAVRHVLDCLAGLGRPRARHRIEHIETIPDDLVPRFAALDVAASMQPSHATDYTRADGTDNWSTRLGRERAGRGWRCADLLRAGAAVVLGSDWPVAPFDPRLVLHAAVTRRDAGDPGADPVQPEQALTISQALSAMTSAPAEVAGRRSGRIAPGYDADLTVFAQDPRLIGPAELPDLEVRHTIVNGRRQFGA